jgi:hypothetical protein
MDSSDLDGYIESRIRVTAPDLLPSVRPIAATDLGSKRVRLSGSAVLLWHNGHRYMITAAHVILPDPDLVYSIDSITKWVQLEGSFRATTLDSKDNDEDLLDFAYQRVDDQFAQQLDGCVFLPANRVAHNDPLEFRPGLKSKYVAVGYRQNKFRFDPTKRETETHPMSFASVIAPPDAYEKHKIDSTAHILVEFDPAPGIVAEGPNQNVSLKGLSGGGLFRHPGLERIGDVAPTRLAGISVEQWMKARLIVATRIDVILAAIDRDMAG